MVDPTMNTHNYIDTSQPEYAHMSAAEKAEIEGDEMTVADIMDSGVSQADVQEMLDQVAPLVEDSYGPNWEWIPSPVSKKAANVGRDVQRPQLRVGKVLVGR